MKSIILAICLSILSIFCATSGFAQISTAPSTTAITTQTNAKGITTTQLKVSGNCGMCKRHIEEACVIKGVKAAEWNAKTGVLNLKFDSKRTDLNKIAAAIAKSGYDSDLAKADEKVYNKLAKCCQYRDETATKH